jgi:hypothetical protein
MSDATKEAEEDSKTTNAGVEGESDIYEQIRDALMSEGVGVITVASDIQSILETSLPEVSQKIDSMATAVQSINGDILGNIVQLSATTNDIKSSLGILVGGITPSLSTVMHSGGNATMSMMEALTSTTLDTSNFMSAIESQNQQLIESSTASTELTEGIVTSIIGASASIASLVSVLSYADNRQGASTEASTLTSTSSTSVDSDFYTTVSTKVASIESLYNELVTEGRAMKVELQSPNEMSVSVTEMSDEIKTSLGKALSDAVMLALMGEGDGDETDTDSLATNIARALRGLEVNVTNDAFDAFLQKYAYQN